MKLKFLLTVAFLWNATLHGFFTNGNFEEGTLGWNSWGGSASDTALSGTSGAYVSNSVPAWRGIHQVVMLPPSTRFISLGGHIRTDSVVGGAKNWERARIAIEFLNEKDEMVGDYPAALGEVQGTTPWTQYIREYSIPNGTKKAKIVCALGNATGTAYFDDIALIAWDKDGNVIESSLDMDIKPIPQAAQPNHLYGGDFESIGAWNLFGDLANGTSAPQPWVNRTGRFALQVSNRKPSWSGAEQLVLLDSLASKIKISGYMKLQDVSKGALDYEQARFTVEFLNEAGTQIGGYPPISAQSTGSQDWTYYEKEYELPTGTRQIKVMAGLGNVTGTAWFDDIHLTVFNTENKPVAPLQITGPLSEGKWYALPVDTSASGSHFVDWSGLLHKPAGKHGFLKTTATGDFAFANGTPVKFWGANLVGKDIFREHAEMDSLAKRLSQMGGNILRLHHADAPWAEPNIFGNSKTTTMELDSSSLDKLDYLIYACKQRGIYIYLDLLVHRAFLEGDSVRAPLPDLGGKQVGIFDPRVIELQKRFITQLLTHVNPYTGVAYKDEPAIMGSEYINESTIYTHFSKDLLTPGSPYRKALDSMYTAQGGKGSLTTYTHDWKPNNRGILKVDKHGENHVASMQFLSNLELSYYEQMRKHMRSLGVKYPLSGTNYPPQILATLRNNTHEDVIISNDYWDHPQVWKIGDDWGRVDWAPLHNGSQLKQPQSSLVHTKSFSQVVGKPFIITEWNHCGWNEQMLEAVPLMAAYGSLHSWDGLIQFDMDQDALGSERIKQLPLSRSPDDILQWITGTPLYLRGDVKTALSIVVEDITDSMVLQTNSYSTFQEEHDFLPFVARISKRFLEKGKPATSPESPAKVKGAKSVTVAQLQKYHDTVNGTYSSETGELLWNYKQGLLQITTQKTQGMVGYLKNKPYTGDFLQANIQNTYASIFVTSADNKPLAKSKHLYLVAAGPSKSTGIEYNSSRTGLRDLGQLPILTQVVQGKATLKIKKGQTVQVRYLRSDGSLVHNETMQSDGSITLNLSQEWSPVMEIIVGKE
jgi:hypothetical protein